MASDGKSLEALVAFVENTLLQEDFKVDTNSRVFNDDGVQIAEFDVEIRGKIGSTEIAWLIECRDRPTSGPAPAAWIEQLVGRRTRFGFNKITAVSTTGFAVGAVEFALAQGIEIREVKALDPEQFKDWLGIDHIQHVERTAHLRHASLLFDDSEPEARREELLNYLAGVSGDVPLLKSSKTGEVVTAASAFAGAVNGIEGVFDNASADEPRTLRLHATYPTDDHYIVECASGPMRISGIYFEGELRVTVTKVPLLNTAEYRQADTKDVISQVASFVPQSIGGMKFSTEFHEMTDTGETHIILRRLPGDA